MERRKLERILTKQLAYTVHQYNISVIFLPEQIGRQKGRLDRCRHILKALGFEVELIYDGPVIDKYIIDGKEYITDETKDYTP